MVKSPALYTAEKVLELTDELKEALAARDMPRVDAIKRRAELALACRAWGQALHAWFRNKK